MEFTLVIFDRFQEREFCIGMLRETARIKEPAFPFCLAFNNPFSQQFAMTAAFTNARTKPCDTIGIAHAWNRADKRHTIWCIGDWAIDDGMNACLSQRWQSFENAFHIIKTSIKIIWTKRHGKVWVNAIHAERFTSLFIYPDKQSLFFLA